MAKLFFQIAQDQQTNAELVAGLDHVLVGVGEKWKLQQNHLSDSALMDHFLDFIRFAQNRNSVSCLVDVLLADQTNGAQTDLSLSLQPLAQLFGSATGSNQQRLVFIAENS